MENNTRPNALFLSVVAQLNGEIATNILTCLAEQFVYLSGLEQGSQATVNKFKKEASFRKQVVEFFKSVDIGFEDLEKFKQDFLYEQELQEEEE